MRDLLSCIGGDLVDSVEEPPDRYPHAESDDRDMDSEDERGERHFVNQRQALIVLGVTSRIWSTVYVTARQPLAAEARLGTA